MGIPPKAAVNAPAKCILARAAELQEGSTICRVHWDEIRRSNNRCSVPTENHSRGLRKQRILARLFAVLDAIGTTCHATSKWPLELLLSGSLYLNFHSLLFTEEIYFYFLHKSALSLSKYMSLLLNWINLFINYISLGATFMTVSLQELGDTSLSKSQLLFWVLLLAM